MNGHIFYFILSRLSGHFSFRFCYNYNYTRTKVLNLNDTDTFVLSSLEEIEQMDRQRLQAIEALQISGNSQVSER
jgi:hypothetical protein